MRPKAPSINDNEQEYLSERLVWGKPIYDAAFNGNPEAQYIMSILYRDHIRIARSNYRLSEKWYNMAVNNGWLDIAPGKTDFIVSDFVVKKAKSDK